MVTTYQFYLLFFPEFATVIIQTSLPGNQVCVFPFKGGGIVSDLHNSPYRQIILAIDGSEHASAAVNLIQNLPIPKDCKILILTVLIPRNSHYRATLSNLLEQTKIKLELKKRSVETILLTGNPGEQIIKYAFERKPDLIVLGAKGLRGTIRIFLGGVAQQVVEYAPCPVLIVRAPHIEAKRILFVTDGSAHSKYAIKHLGLCPIPAEANVTILHVMPPEMTPDMLLRYQPYGIDSLPPVLTDEVQQGLIARTIEEKELGEELLKGTLNEFSKLKIKAKTVLLRGDSATEILNYADENQIDLIIAGSRGLSQMSSWFLGSVSSKLTHYAKCSVLIVRMPSVG
jgi:nucleotide-binding universal stress UspA family protein